jgi:hypothetical protein
MSLKASFRSILGYVGLLLISCATALAQANLNEQALHKFVDETLHGPTEVIAQKQSSGVGNGIAIYVAVLCRSQHGKNVLIVIETDRPKFNVVWSSAEHRKSLGVVAADSLQLRVLDGKEYFTLLGCNPHDCGGIDGSYNAEVFQVSTGHTRQFDIWGCAQQDRTLGQTKPQLCVSGDDRADNDSSSDLRRVVIDLLHEKISGANGILIQFEPR